jgi:hypothetical protein
MRSIAISVFILMFFFVTTLVTAFNSDVMAINPDNAILQTRTAPRSPTGQDVGLNNTISGLDSLNLLDQPQNELERQGSSFGRLTMTEVIKTVIVNSTIGFANYVKLLLGVSEGSSAAILLDLAQWLIILNHAFALFQILRGPLGGSL